MDANALRLILVVLGIIVVGSIYLWDRSRREKKPSLNLGPERAVDDHDILFSKSAGMDTASVHDELIGLDQQIHQTRSGAQTLDIQPDDRPLNTATTTPDADVRKTDEQIIVLSVTARSQQGFRGEDIVSAARKADLEFGDMGIFHHYVSASDPACNSFSMASMVEPGSFDMDALDRFSTPGLTFFMRAPGEQSDLSLFSDMLTSARSMANSLDGDVRDKTHSTLTQKSIQHIREEIVEHRRRHQVLH